MNYFDLISSIIVILALYLIPKNRKYWALYALGCFLWVLLHFTKGLYFGMIMNIIAMFIGLKNLRNQIGLK